jgi:hypothetical protein
VKIGPIVYEVKEVSRLADEQLFGQICYTEGVIEMRPNLTPIMQEITLFHEIIHGMLLQGGVREHDERILDVLAHGFTALFKDNPQLVAVKE